MPAPAEPPVSASGTSEVDLAKAALRDEVLTARRHRSRAESLAAEEAIAQHVLSWEVVRRAVTVAAYVSVGREPGTAHLLPGLHALGKKVLLPVLRSDNDLDWVLFTGDLADLAPASRGLLEPVGSPLGVGAIADADVVLVPGLAASASGDRLGRGGGSYDRALARVQEGVSIALLLHEDETCLAVPTDRHDRRVTHVVTPAGISP